jgi:TonB family protein
LQKSWQRLYIGPVVKKLFWVFLLLSLLVHLGSYWGSLAIDLTQSPATRSTKSIDIEIVENPPKSAQDSPMIRFAEPPKELLDESLEALKKKAELLSEKVRRVKKEMRAELFGLTKNRWQTAATKSFENNSKTPSAKEAALDNGNDGFRKEQERTANDSNPLSFAPSTFGNQLNKNVELGQFTALNTDRHLYYSFYSRIEELIRPPWEEKVSAESRRVSGQKLIVPKNGWTTRIDVILNASGQLNRVILLKGSGIKGLDEAAIEAFYKANFFPHPPKEMIGEDGTIVLKYIFSVY